MKRIFNKYIPAIFAVLLFSCVKLDPVSYSEYSPANFPKTEDDLKAMVLSCYQPLSSYGILDVQFWNECMTNTVVGAYGTQQACHTLAFDETTGDLTNYYKFASQISRATLVIDAIENSVLSDALKKRYIAEVRCSRAYLMYTLFDLFGGLIIAPIEILKNPLQDQPLPRSSIEETAAFIEADLIAAAEGLPYPKNAEYGKFSKGFANMLLIRLYLHETIHFTADGKVTRNPENYHKVETVARELMKPEYGYALAPSYTDMFTVGKQAACRNEFILAFPSSITGPNVHYWQLKVMPTNVGTSAGGDLAGWQTLAGDWKFFDTFEPADSRKKYMIDEYINLEGSKQDRSNPGDGLKFGPVPLKYYVDDNIIKQSSMSLADRVIYRYADVLLSLAEALVFKPGGTVNQEALDLINEVRRRANLPDKQLADVPSKKAFEDLLLLERAHEFWCENGQYRADLIRFDKLLEVILEANNGIAPRASKYKYLYPLPNYAIVDGKGKVHQNPGYR
ncbi:RagB/SusD family nutrient uptake outer membrane protein [Chitinophaga defluvii]|uniref:RagB/SusD family nutrient uptake outer membrane protein n=1 Tax=Chitinophaga defluvii TaxID=3163343 RepID=A0ABV2T0R4_9BACT